MFALTRMIEGLLIAHLALIASFLIGAALFPWCDDGEAGDLSGPETLLRTIATIGLGFAAFGFCAFALAAIGAFTPVIYFPAVLIVAIAGCALWRRNPLKAVFWRARLNSIVRCWDVPSLLIYLVMMVLALPAIIANMGGSDAVGYHLAYAREWASAGRLIVDPFMRLPFYASNFALLFAVLMSVHAEAFVNFLSWAMALLTALGVYSAARATLGSRMKSLEAAVASLALAFTVIVSPAFLRWMDTAYIDTAIGAFALFALLCVMIAISERRYQWLAAGAVTAGFLIGMKGSFFVLTPVFALMFVMAFQNIKPGIRSIMIVLALLVVSASPWYARNVVLAGDIAPPEFNVALYGSDGLITKGEWQQNQSDLSTPKTPSAVAELPYNAFAHAQDRMFREYGVTGLMLLLYVPAIVLLILYGLGKPIDGRLAISAVYVTLLVGYWIASSSLLRYASLFYPSLAVALACSVAAVLPRKNLAGVVAAAICVLTLMPSPDSSGFYHETISSHFRYLPDSYKSDDYYLDRFSPDYHEVQFVATLPQKGRVYTLGPRVQYNFEQKGIQSIGDWMGPAGYFRLYRAVDARRAADFMKNLDVTSVLITPAKVIGGLEVPLERQLRSGGFCEVDIPESSDRLFVSDASRCSHGAVHGDAHANG